MQLLISCIALILIASLALANISIETNPKPKETSSNRQLKSKDYSKTHGQNAVYPKNVKKMSKIYKDHELHLEKPTEKLLWRNIVFVILTYNNESANRLLEAQFDTWMKRVGWGLDIILVVDENDKRRNKDIIPKNKPKSARIQVYRSPAQKEGKKARAKVIDGLNHTRTLFENRWDKKFFVKVDPDSFLIPERFLEHLDEVYSLTNPLPVDFGNCACTPMCYSTGGLYAFSKQGLLQTLDYIEKNPSIYDDVVKDQKDKIQHEDFFTSYAFWKATSFPVICSRETSIVFYKHHLISPNVTSIHNVKDPIDAHYLDKIFYDEDGLPNNENSLEEKHELYLRHYQAKKVL